MSKAKKQEKMPNPVLFCGLFLIFLSIFVGISLYSVDPGLSASESAKKCLTGLVGSYLAFYIITFLGEIPAIAITALTGLWGLSIILRREVFSSWPKVFGGLTAVTGLVLLICCSIEEPTATVNGIYGSWLNKESVHYIGSAGSLGLGLGMLLLGSWLMFSRQITFLWHKWTAACRLGWGWASAGAAIASDMKEKAAERLEVIKEARAEKAALREAERAEKEAAAAALAEAEAEEEEEPEEEYEEEETEEEVEDGDSDEEQDEIEEEEEETEPEPEPRGNMLQKRLVRRTKRKPPKRARKSKGKDGRILVRTPDYLLPSPDLLTEAEPISGESRSTIEKRASVLEQTLSDFKIDGKVVGIESGPRVTMFELSLAPGIRVERIFSLANNITMALKALNVRIVAPIPGKDTVGIEIPNMNDNTVFMKSIYEDYDLDKNSMAAPMFLGSDITGAPIIADLARMPHLLIAGATGSGKSVCINTILMSMLLAKRPDELKMILIDPKMVELSRFADIPHLMSPVVTDMKRAAGILEWACVQMDKRYEQMAMLGVNNISKFNALGEEKIIDRLQGKLSEAEIETFPKKMAYVVIVVDELADLMLVAGKEVEKSIIRLASKSRAVGIHVILATQRPSVDVITGLIKANMPSRIAFQVSSKVDSRTILDNNGAEALLGAGDMLFLPPGSSKLARAQGVYVSDDELFGIIDHCKEQARPEYHDDLKGAVIGGTGSASGAEDRDEIFDQAVRAVIESQRGSVSLLQRKFGIGYGRASRIIDQMEEAGILGPYKEGKARDIMLDMEQYEEAFCNPNAFAVEEDEDDYDDEDYDEEIEYDEAEEEGDGDEEYEEEEEAEDDPDAEYDEEEEEYEEDEDEEEALAGKSATAPWE